MSGMSNTKRAIKKLQGMTQKERKHYLNTAQRVTTGTISQVVKDEHGKNVFKTWYVAKIRGVIVGGKNNWKFETKVEAKLHGLEVLNYWHSLEE